VEVQTVCAVGWGLRNKTVFAPVQELFSRCVFHGDFSDLDIP
jgi:hypothetical protein